MFSAEEKLVSASTDATTSASDPLITPAPQTPSPALCGWVSGIEDYTETCGASLTCFVNPELNVVGCGYTSFVNYFTTCVDFSTISSCLADPSCSGNTSVFKCDTTAQYCHTDIYPSSISGFACQSASTSRTNSVQFSYTGAIGNIILPRYLNDAGVLSYGTQGPVVSGTSTLVSVSASTTTSTSQAGTTSTTQSSGTTPAPTPKSKTGAIVGGVVGGILALVLLGVLLFLHRRSKKKKESADEGDGIGGSRAELDGEGKARAELYATGGGKSKAQEIGATEKVKGLTVPEMEAMERRKGEVNRDSAFELA